VGGDIAVPPPRDLRLPAAVREGAADPWRERAGTGLLLSAPHEVEHRREGRSKRAETGTAALAFALAAELGAAALCTADVQRGDSNWDVGHAYVDRAAALAAGGPVLDLHVMRPRGVDICLGLGPRPALVGSLWRVLADEAVAAGLRLAVNWPFAAGPRTVTGQLQARGVAAVQVELAATCFESSGVLGMPAWEALRSAAAAIVS
jgi:hypothetical protein